MYSEKKDRLAGIDPQIVGYLLNEAGEDEISTMEERLASDTAFFELVASIEDDLIMQYVRGDMEASFRPRFEKAYLETPERRARIESARQLRTAVREVAAFRKSQTRQVSFFTAPWMRVALATIVLAAGMGSWLWWKKTASSSISADKPLAMSITLQPGRVRSGEGTSAIQFAIPTGMQEIHFNLKVVELPAFRSYQVVVGTPERPGVFRGAARVENGTITTTVPAKLLPAGDYTLELQGMNPDGNQQLIATYYFRAAL